jgi:hypothetical protein
MPLEWKPIPGGNGSSISECGNYSTGVAEDGRWQTWKIAPGGAWFAPLARGLTDEAAARAVAQADADAKAGT